MSKNLCEAWVKRRVRDTSQSPRWLAYLWLNMATPRWCEEESTLEFSKLQTISKRRYGMETEGNPVMPPNGMKSKCFVCKRFWLQGYKPCASVEGAKSEKMVGQIKEILNKTYHPELGCSGSLSPTVTVQLVNVGTSCLGQRTGLAATDVRHEGRSSRSSLRYGKHTTWRRTTANRKS